MARVVDQGHGQALLGQRRAVGPASLLARQTPAHHAVPRDEEELLTRREDHAGLKRQRQLRELIEPRRLVPHLVTDRRSTDADDSTIECGQTHGHSRAFAQPHAESSLARLGVGHQDDGPTGLVLSGHVEVLKATLICGHDFDRAELVGPKEVEGFTPQSRPEVEFFIRPAARDEAVEPGPRGLWEPNELRQNFRQSRCTPRERILTQAEPVPNAPTVNIHPHTALGQLVLPALFVLRPWQDQVRALRAQRERDRASERVEVRVGNETERDDRGHGGLLHSEEARQCARRHFFII